MHVAGIEGLARGLAPGGLAAEVGLVHLDGLAERLEVRGAVRLVLAGQLQDAPGAGQVGVLGEPALELGIGGFAAAPDQLLELQIAQQALVGNVSGGLAGGVEVALGGGLEGGGIGPCVGVGQGFHGGAGAPAGGGRCAERERNERR